MPCHAMPSRQHRCCLVILTTALLGTYRVKNNGAYSQTIGVTSSHLYNCLGVAVVEVANSASANCVILTRASKDEMVNLFESPVPLSPSACYQEGRQTRFHKAHGDRNSRNSSGSSSSSNNNSNNNSNNGPTSQQQVSGNANTSESDSIQTNRAYQLLRWIGASLGSLYQITQRWSNADQVQVQRRLGSNHDLLHAGLKVGA
jgi:hypothetical protein